MHESIEGPSFPLDASTDIDEGGTGTLADDLDDGDADVDGEEEPEEVYDRINVSVLGRSILPLAVQAHQPLASMVSADSTIA
jgi:hypothetical protein